MRNTLRNSIWIALALVAGAARLWAQPVRVTDRFTDNRGGWQLSTGTPASASLGERGYTLRHEGEGSYLFLSSQYKLEDGRDFDLKVSLEVGDGETADAFGLVWGASDAGNCQGILLDGYGAAKPFRLKANGYSPIGSPLTVEESAVLPGATLDIALSRQGRRLGIWVNDKFLTSFLYEGIAGPRMGFMLMGTRSITVKSFQLETHADFVPQAREDFNTQPVSWSEGRCMKYEPGKLTALGCEAGMLIYALGDPGVTLTAPVELEFKMDRAEGATDKAVGVLFGMSADTPEGYGLFFNGLGAWRLEKLQNGRTPLTSWTPADYAIPRQGAITLRIRMYADTWVFYANELRLGEAPAQPLMGNRVGLAATFGPQISLDAFIVRGTVKEAATPPPAIVWHNPARMQESVTEKKINLKAEVKPVASLRSVIVYLNERPVITLGPRAETTPLLLEQSLDLAPGNNEIRLFVQDINGATVSESRTLVLKEVETAGNQREGTDYALIIATDDYTTWTDLVNPINDARTIAAELEGHYGYKVEVLENAQKKDILNKLKEYARRTYQPGDQLLIFFAGHGKFDEYFGEGYVVCANSEKEDEGNDTYISHSSLRTIVNNIPCKHVFLMMDVCFGGTIDPYIAQGGHRGNDAYRELGQNEFIERKLRFRTRRYLTSGGKEYVPDGTPGQHSPFTRKFIEALRSYGGEDKILTLGEMLLYFERLVPEPRFGEFGTNEPGSDFLFIAR